MATFTTALAACGRGRHWQGSIKLLEEMLQRKLCDTVCHGVRRPNLLLNCGPRAMNSAVTSLAAALRWEEALSLYEPSSPQGCHALLSHLVLSSKTFPASGAFDGRWWQALHLFQALAIEKSGGAVRRCCGKS